MAQKNPWNIGSLYEFFYFNCPSCPFRSKSNQEFVNHACNFHPEAGPYLQNIQDNSINDIHVPYHEFESKVSNDRIENKNEEAFTVDAIESDKVEVDDNMIKSELEEYALSFEKDDDFEENGDRFKQNEDKENKDFVENEEESFAKNDNVDNDDFKCKICDKFYTTKTGLKYHLKKDHDKNLKDSFYKCNLCTRGFAYKECLKSHFKKCHNEMELKESLYTREDYKCDICEKPFINKKSLFLHNEKFHKQDLLEKLQHCSSCDKYFKNMIALSAHNTLIHPDVKNYQCEWCEEAFKQFKCLKKHVLFQHKEKSNSKLQCEKCNQMVAKDYYKMHLARVHLEANKDKIDQLEKIQCQKCELWIQKLGMTKHILRIHSEDLCECDFCGKQYSNQAKLKSHIYGIHKVGIPKNKINAEKNLKIECLKCQRLIRKSYIEKHILKCQIKCNPCGIKFSNKFEYACHQKEVHPPLEIKCQICGKSYYNASIKQHIKSVHEKIKDFQCAKCGKAFSEKGSLKWHDKMVHTGSRDFKCDQCIKSYKKSHHLKNHIMEVHEGKKDHVCSFCGKPFGNSKNLKRHTDIIHKGIKRWKCDNCTNAYGQSHELKKHMEICHKSPKN